MEYARIILAVVVYGMFAIAVPGWVVMWLMEVTRWRADGVG